MPIKDRCRTLKKNLKYFKLPIIYFINILHSITTIRLGKVYVYYNGICICFFTTLPLYKLRLDMPMRAEI